MHNDHFNYSRDMYGEFCCYPTEVQNKILEYSKIDLRVNRDEDFFQKCLEALIKTRKEYLPNDKDVFYDNGKYVSRSLNHYGLEQIPNKHFEYENHLTDVLAEPLRDNITTGTPIKELAIEYEFYSSSEIQACQFATTIGKYIAIYSNDEDCKKDYGSPGEYAGEAIETMGDLFLQAMFCIYTNLVIPEKVTDK